MVAAMWGAAALTCSQVTSGTGTRDGPLVGRGFGARAGLSAFGRGGRAGPGARGKSVATMSPGAGHVGIVGSARAENPLLIKANRRRSVAADILGRCCPWRADVAQLR